MGGRGRIFVKIKTLGTKSALQKGNQRHYRALRDICVLGSLEQVEFQTSGEEGTEGCGLCPESVKSEQSACPGPECSGKTSREKSAPEARSSG